MEAMAVVGIAGIVAAAALVRMSSTSEERSAMAARQLLRDVAFARQRAVATGTRSWVEFSTASQFWKMRAGTPRAAATLLDDPAVNDDFIQDLNTGAFAGVTLTAVNVDWEDWIGFDWIGRPLKKTAETTPLAADATFTFSGGEVVTVNKDTGHATLSP